MARCVVCGRWKLFLKEKAGLCTSCFEQRKEDCRREAREKYEFLIEKYAQLEQHTVDIDNCNREKIEKGIEACKEFIKIVQELKITKEFDELFMSRVKVEYGSLQLIDLGNSRFYMLNDEKNATKALDRLCACVNQQMLQLKLIKAAQDEINALPRYPILVDEKEAPKRVLSELDTISFSRITKKTPREKLGDFVAVDVETTGLNVSTAEVVEIAAVRYKNFEPVECFTTLCNTKRDISEEISRINGITNEMVTDKPSFRQVVKSLQTFVGEDNLVGHNLLFDLKFMVKYGFDINLQKRRYYDTLLIAQYTLKRIRKKWDKEIEMYVEDYEGNYDVLNYKLTTLCKYYGIPIFEAHRALADCYATGLLFYMLAKEKE